MTKKSKSEEVHNATPSPSDNIGPYHMTQEILQERSEDVNAGRFATQMYAGVLASISSISFGTMLGWSSPAIRATVDRDFRGGDALDKSIEFSWVASLGPLGCALGVVIWSYFNIKLGPKTTMCIQSPFLFIAWGVIGYLERDQSNLEWAMRFFCGFFAISYRICGETLLSDTVHRFYLKKWVTIYRACVNFGVLLSYIMGYSVTDRFFSYFNCTIVLVHFIMLLICPESPIYLYDKSLKKAEKSLSWYRGRKNIYVDMRSIKKDADIRKVDPTAYKYMLYSKVVVKAIAIVMMVTLAQVFSCYYVFLYFNPAVVRSLANSVALTLEDVNVNESDDALSRNMDACILGLNMFVSCILSTWIHYRVIFGIRKPVIISCVLVTIILTTMAIYMYFYETKYPLVYKHNNWIYQLLVNALVACFELGLSCCPDIMLMDYIPNQVFPRAKLILKLAQWLTIFFVTKYFFHITTFIYGSGTFALFAGASLALSIGACLWVVESKGKTLIQVQTAIGGNPIGSRGVYNKKLVDSNEALLSF